MMVQNNFPIELENIQSQWKRARNEPYEAVIILHYMRALFFVMSFSL